MSSTCSTLKAVVAVAQAAVRPFDGGVDVAVTVEVVPGVDVDRRVQVTAYGGEGNPIWTSRTTWFTAQKPPRSPELIERPARPCGEMDGIKQS